jgi:predicted metal-binding membrane protein
MTSDVRGRARIHASLLFACAIGWGLLLVQRDMALIHRHDPAIHTGAMRASYLQMLLTVNPLASLAAGWVLMLTAMMSPALIRPIHHLCSRSFRHRRPRAVVLFAAAYAAIWLAAGGGLLAAGLAVTSFAPAAHLPAVLGVLIALVWQCSPAKQRCLNRCHAHPELAAFGTPADVDSLRFGATHGIWCAGSCWALMLLPMLLPDEHLLTMVAVTLLITSERLERPRPPRWALRGFGKATRIVVAQSRLRLQGMTMVGAVRT